MENVKVKAWPFLMSRNSQRDYWPLVVHPSFLEEDLPYILARAVSGAPTPPNCALYREIHNSPAGNFTLVFRVLQAKSYFVDLPGTDLLLDQSQSPIKIFEGIVLEGLVPHITITEKDFQIIHEAIKPVYKHFWVAGEKRPPVKSLPSFFLSSESATNPRLKLLVEAPPAESPPLSAQRPIPVPEKREEEPDQGPPVPQPPHTSEWERKYRRLRILIGTMLVLLVIGFIVLLVTFYVLPTFFSTPPPTPIPTLTPTSTH